MKFPKSKLIAGSRGSLLALKQTYAVIDLLKTTDLSLQIEVKIVTTRGEHLQHTPLAKIGGKGLFTKELENSLFAGETDFAVHSLKDLPVALPSGLSIAAYLKREQPNDVLISKEDRTLRDIPQNGVVATGSLRRKLQLLEFRNDLQIVDVRGNVDTRIQKLYTHNWDGLILAYAGLKRLERTELISEIIPEKVLYPAVGQGIIAVECRTDTHFYDLFAAINDLETEACAIAERAFLEGLGGGCQVPVGIVSKVRNGVLHLSGKYMPEEGKYIIRNSLEFDASQPAMAGKTLAEEILHTYANRKSVFSRRRAW